MVFLPVVVLLAMVSLGELQAAVGGCSPLVRAVVASWDSPTAQAVDDLAGHSIPYPDPAGPIRAHVAQVRDAHGCHVVPAEDGRVVRPGVDTSVTRSPPTV